MTGQGEDALSSPSHNRTATGARSKWKLPSGIHHRRSRPCRFRLNAARPALPPHRRRGRTVPVAVLFHPPSSVLAVLPEPLEYRMLLTPEHSEAREELLTLPPQIIRRTAPTTEL
ncbi:hypothetical protein BV20DRAFT_296473 [Pilatotrama ljubarskyi]|nr:hypothetical protein BV20DRAFT_296473 [Pilatotrama ljubarskyi]